MKKLLNRLPVVAKDAKIPTKDFPKSPRWASTRLRELAPVLRAAGVIVEQLKPENKCRPWQVYAIDEIDESATAEAATAAPTRAPAAPTRAPAAPATGADTPNTTQ